MYKLCTLAIIALSGLFTLTACGGAAAPTTQTLASPKTLTIESICADNPFDSVCVSSIYAAARAQVVSRCTINPAGCSAEVMTCISNPFDEKCVFVAYGEAYESVRSSLVSTCSTGSGASCNTALLTSVGGDDTPSIAACIADPFIAQCIQSNNFVAYRAPHIAACEANFNTATCTLAQAAVCAIGTVAHVNPFSALCMKEDNEYDDIRLRHVDACRDGTNGDAICTGVTACNTRPFAAECIENTAFVRARRDLIAKCIIGDAVLTNPDCTNAVADGETLTCLTNPYGDDCLAANQLGAAEVQSGGQSIITTARMERLDYCGEMDANADICGAEVLAELCTVTQNPFASLCVDAEGETKFADARVTFLEGVCTATQNPFAPACLEGDGETKFAPARVEFVDNCRDADPTPADCTADIIACNTAPFGDDCKDDIYDNARVAFAPLCNVAEADRPDGCAANVIACNANPYDADAFDGAGCTRIFFPIPKNLTAFCLADTAWSVGCDTLATNTLSVRRKRAELAGNCLAIDSADYCDSAIGGTVGGQTVFSCLQTPYHPDCRDNRAFDQTRIAFCVADTAWDENCDDQAVADSQVVMERTKLAKACVASDTEPYCARLVGVNGQNVFKCNERPLDPDCVDNIAFATIGAKFCVETSPWHEDCDIQATAGSDIRNIRERLAQACEDASAPPCSDTIGADNTVFSCTETPFDADCVGNIAFNAAKVAYCTATPWDEECDEVGADDALDYDAILANRKLQIATCENADAFPCNRSLGEGDETVFFCKANAFMDACNTNDAFIDIRANFCVGDTAWNTRCDKSSMDTQEVRDQRGELAIGCLDTTTFDYCSTAIGTETVYSCGQDPFLADCAANEAFNKATVEFCTAEATAWDTICDTAAMIDIGDLAVIRESRGVHAAKCTGDDSSISYTQPAFCTTEGGGRAFGDQTIQTCIVTPFHPDCVGAGVAGFDAAKDAYCLADATAWESGCNGEPYASNPDVIAKRAELAKLTCEQLGVFDYCDYFIGGSGQTVHTCYHQNPLKDVCAANPAFDAPREVFCTETVPWHAFCDVLADPDTEEGRAVITARAELANDCGTSDAKSNACSRRQGSLLVRDCIVTPLDPDCVDNPAFADLVAVFCTETNPWHEHCNEQAGAEISLVQTTRKFLVTRCSEPAPPAYCTANKVGDTGKTVRFCAQNPLNTDCMANDAFDVLGDVFCTEGNPWHADCNEQAAGNPAVLAERKRLAVLCERSTGYCGLPVSVGSNFSVVYCIGDPLHRDCAANPAFDELGVVFCLEVRPWHGRCDDAANPDTEAGIAIIAKRADLAEDCGTPDASVTACSRRQGSLLVRDCRVKPFDPNCTNPAFNDIREAHCAAKTTFWDTGCDTTTDMIGQARMQVVEDCNVVGTKPAYCRAKVNSATVNSATVNDCVANPFTTGCEDNTAFDALKFPYCDDNTRTWSPDCDNFSRVNQDILHKRRDLVKACTGNSQPDYCTERTFSEARYDTTTTVYTVRYAGRKLGNEHFGPPVLESDYGEGVVTKTEVTATDISESKQSSHAGPQYHGANGAVFSTITTTITVVTSVLREERATKTLAECFADPFQEICAHRLHEDSTLSLGPPLAEAAAAFDVYCADARNAWKDNCRSNVYAGVTRSNDCIANGEISHTSTDINNMDIKTIIVADDALFSDICSRADTISEDITLNNRKNNLSEGDEGYENPRISVSAERKRRVGRCPDPDAPGRRDDCGFIIYQAITARECVATDPPAGCDSVKTNVARVTACRGDAGAEECDENAREAVTVGDCVKNPTDVDCLGERNQSGKNAALCRADSTADACNLLVTGANSASITGTNATICQDSLRLGKKRSVRCDDRISSTSTLTIQYCLENPYEDACSSVTYADCLRSPFIKACRGIRTFFTAFADVLEKLLKKCSGNGGENAYSDEDCRIIPQNLTNLITRCREKSHANYNEEHCEDIRPQITACEAVDDPFNFTGVPDAGGVSCRNVAFDNLLTQHRDNCETNFGKGTRDASCKRIYDLTCAADGTGIWVDPNSPLCLLQDERRSFYREIAFCALETTSATHPACRTVPRNWQTWFDSATTETADTTDAIGSVVNGWATSVGDVLDPTPSGFLALPVGSNTIDFATGRFHLPITRTHTLTLDSTRINLPNAGDKSDNEITADSGVNSRGAGSINHFQGDALDGIIFGRAYKVDTNATESQNRRFYAAILPTTDLGGPVQTSGTANWNGAVSYIRDDGDIIDVAGRGANLNTVNRAVNLSVNFSNRTIDGTFRIDHNNVVSRDAEFMLLRMSYNPAGIIKGEVQLGRTHVSHPDTGRPTFVDGFRHDAGASKLTGIIGAEGAVGVFYTDGVVRQVNGVNKRLNHLVGGFVACPSKSVNGSPRCKTNGQ